MLNKIIKLSLQNRLIVMVAAALLIGFGSYTATTIEVDAFPDLNAPTVVVMTEATGMAPEEVERTVTFPVETALNGATSIRRVRSASTPGFSVVWAEFDWDMDIYRARQIVSERLTELEGEMPPGVGKTTMGPQSSILGEVLIVGMTADTTSMLDLKTLADWKIRTRLLALGGVSQVSVIGGDTKEYQILLHPERMAHLNVSLGEVLAAAQAMSVNAAGGTLTQYGNEYIVQGLLSTNDVEEIGRAVVRENVLLEDIADVKVGAKRPLKGTASMNGREAVLLTVVKQSNVNTLELTEKLEKAVEELQAEMPADVKLSTDLFRQADFIEGSISNIQRALWEGSIFVVVVLFFFLMNFRTTVISLTALPLSLLTTFLIMKAMGLTINTMSLGGMAIAIGSLVDDAIVDVENVFRRLRENRGKPAGERIPFIRVIFEASKEVRMPILNSTLIIVASFLPLFFLSGMEGRMLVPLGIAFIVSLFASTVVALVFTPVFCSYLLPLKWERKENVAALLEENVTLPAETGAEREAGVRELREPAFARFLKKHYRNGLEWSLRHRRAILGTTFVLLIAAVVMMSGFGRSFLPPFNEGALNIVVSTMPGTSLEESAKIGAQVERAMLEFPEVRSVGRKSGRAELDEHAAGVNVSEMEVPFTLGERSRDEFMDAVRERLAGVSGASIELGQPISHRINAMLSGTKASIAIKIFGSDLNRMYAIGTQIKENIAPIEGVVDLNVEQQVERPQLQLVPRRDMMASYGITLADFSQFVQTALAGTVVSSVYENDLLFDLTLKVDEAEKSSMEQIGNLLVDTPKGKVPLHYIAEVRSSMGPNTINRENVKRKVVVSANVSGRDVVGVVRDIERTVNQTIELPEDYFIQYGGEFESEKSAMRILLGVSILSLIIIFLILFGQFKSVRLSAVILLNLPLAVIGGVFSVRFGMEMLSIPAIIGFISLLGIATRNGILLVSHYMQLEKEGNTLRHIIFQGSLDRLNPILMTALSSALALIPLALNGSLQGNEIQSPMAQVILGGLLSSTLLNIFVIPVIYFLTERKRFERMGRLA